MKEKLKIFSGRSNPMLAQKIAKSLGKKIRQPYNQNFLRW
jgi:phosphoribosylpyrophosphate synthetase